jgi:hypothetical protein
MWPVANVVAEATRRTSLSPFLEHPPPQVVGSVAVLVFLSWQRYVAAVEVSAKIQCPFCGQAFDLVVDTSTASQRFTTDCEVCCRPFEVFAECEPGKILSLDVQGG